MVKKTHLHRFVKDENAISEEFTSLPALSVVMVGFALFILLFSNTYVTYSTRIDSLEKYQTADFIATKLTNPDCFFMKEGGVVALPLLDTQESRDKIKAMRTEYTPSGINFSIRVNWDSNSLYFPEDTLPTGVGDRVAVSRDVSVYLNQAQTRPGKLTIIIWSV